MTGATVNISVIVCTYNRSESLARTLQSLRGQAVPSGLSWEVVVVDNNSTDETRAVVSACSSDPAFPVRYCREERQGLSHARNRGIAEARGRYLAFTDDDVLAPPEWVAAVFDALERGGWDGIGGRVFLRSERAMPKWLKRELWGFLACLDYGDQTLVLADPGKPFFGANMAFRRDIFDRIGGFDPELGRKGKSLVGGEETDVFYRMLKAGMQILYEPRAFVNHVVDSRRLRKRYFRGLHYSSGWMEGLRFGDYQGWHVLGIPGFVFHHLLRSLGDYTKGGIHEGFHNVFRKEMTIWYFLGFMAGRVRHRFAEGRSA